MIDMILNKKVVCIGIIGLFILTGLSGCLEEETGIIRDKINIPVGTIIASGSPKYAMASYYSSEEVTIELNVSQYELPLNLSLIVNLENITSLLNLDDDQKDLLSGNGFVVRDYGHIDDIIQPYEDMKTMDIPVFVTSDTLLHLYHIQFDEILKGIEEREFFDKILDMSKTLFDQSKKDYQTFTDEQLKEAARKNIAFFAVGLSLLQIATEGYDGSEDIKEVSFSTPNYVQENVSEELSYIEAQDGYYVSPIFHYYEDYSQYKPRGHYTRSEKLKRYFKAMMWYGRISFLMKGGEPHCQYCDFLISEEDAKVQTIQASLIATALPSLTLNDESLDSLWNRIYTVTSFFVGASDDLTPYEYLDSILEVYGSEFDTTELADDEKLLELKIKLTLLRNPEIYGGTGQVVILKSLGSPITIEDLNEVLEKTKGMRLMGQRYIPDSYMFQQLVSPAVGYYTGSGEPFTMKMTDLGPVRAFPRGLDVMAVLGSQRALEILENDGDTEYEYYYDQLNNLTENFSSLNTTEWNRNLYFSWVYTLKSLIKEFNTSYPMFMQTTAWVDKELQTSLASWAELRHDTILYAKQSYTPVFTTSTPTLQEKPVVGYVEPVPEFYTRILALTRMTRTGLADLDVLNETETNRLESLETILQILIDISKDELEGKELSEDDYEFIRDFGENLDSIVTGVKDEGKETTIIADVHTDTNTPQQVLEEGVGYVDLIIVAYKVPDGRIIAGAGPVFSYYEFKHPMDDRLTDEQWKDMLQNNEEPDRPDWISSFVSE